MQNTESRYGNAVIFYNVPAGMWKEKFNLVNSEEYMQIPNIHLTKREKEVLKLVTEGESNVEIADKLFISVHTAKAHVCNIMQKMGVTDRVKAAVLAIKTNLV